MFGLDDKIAAYSNGTSLLLVAAVAVVLGLRHATDPDHLAAVTTLAANGKERGRRAAARLGLAWGIGHATTLIAFGVPIVVFNAYLPLPLQEGAETTVGLLIVVLAAWLLIRWRRGLFRHYDGHAHGRSPRGRTPLQAYAVGLVHGMGGTAGVGVLLLAAIHSHIVALCALVLFAVCTALSMTLLTTGFGVALGAQPVRRSLHRLAPVLAVASATFGAWYALAALHVLPYYT